MTSPLLEVRGLTGGYDRVPVLHDVELHVGADEIVGILGANGAGKTSLLRALSGALPTARGSVVFAGQELGRRPPWARASAGLAHVPEGRHVLTAMTVRENLDVAALIGRGETTHDEVYALFPRLEERQDQAAGSLSGGEQQMLALGRALMTSPRLLAVDEMSAGLAPVVVQQLVAGLVELRRRGVAVLVVEQSPHFVADAIDRVYLLEQGRIVASGSFEELGGADRLAELYLGVA